jgi:predicted HTH transcriptional regulator
MVSACRDAGLATPMFEEIGMRFSVTLYTDQVQEPTLDKLNETIVSLVRAADGLATHEIAQEISLTPRATRTRLASLPARGLMREVGTGPQDPRRRHYSPE